MYGYVVVFGAFLVYVVVGGFLQSFGIFIDEFNEEFCKPNECLDILGKSVIYLGSLLMICFNFNPSMDK